jgi:hypothetical protein
MPPHPRKEPTAVTLPAFRLTGKKRRGISATGRFALHLFTNEDAHPAQLEERMRVELVIDDRN